MRVAGVGQCCWDYLAQAENYPPVDSKCEVSAWLGQGGGPVATALVTLARLGVTCCIHGVIGDDDLAGKIRRSLDDESVDTGGLAVRRGALSQAAFIVVEKGSGRRTIFWQRATGADLHCDELGDDFLAGTDFLLLDGLMPEVSLHAARQARLRGIPVMLDAGRVRPGMVEIAGNCDYLVAAEQFAYDLGWDGAPESFRAEAARFGARAVTITRGERGSITYVDGRILQVPAFAVDVVDTTGAGDVFHGAYAYGVLRGWDLRDTVVFASATAALKCTRMGGRAGIPTLSQVLAFLDAR